MKTSSEKPTTKIITVIFPIFSVVLILGVSFFIYFFSKGYRINIFDREIIKTGVLTIKSDPSSATLYINEQSSGKTPNSKSLDIGEYNIAIKKEKYFDWNKKISILEERSTLFFPWLVLKEPLKSEKWNSTSTIVSSWTDSQNNTIIYLLKNSETEYSLWSYKINMPIWNFNSNPVEILKLNTKEIDLNLSPNGEFAILKITIDPLKIYILDTARNTTIETAELFDLTEYKKHTISWSQDNKHIILESTKNIISYNTTQQNTTTLLTKEKDQQYIWTTDQEGFFYIITPADTEYENSQLYTLTQYNPEGTQPRTIIENIYMQKEKQYIEYYRENGFTAIPFSNSVETTQTVGQITEIKIYKEAKGAIIKTEYATYWYDITTQKYIMISPYPLTVLELSADLNKLLLTTDKELILFTLDKEEADHTEEIGSRTIINNIENIKNIRWISNSLNIYFTKDNYLYLIDKDGENEYQILNMENIQDSLITSSRENIVTLEKDSNNKTHINQYKIH